jgi:peptide-methionine (R)-S-oxide reductase
MNFLKRLRSRRGTEQPIRQAGGMSDNPESTADDLKLRLTPMQFHVTQEAGTESPFSGEYWDATEPGTYHCIVCDEQLFDSDTKFDAHCGWPSFFQSMGDGKIEYIEDHKMGMLRTEVRCAKCSAHLGHVFPDGPQPTGDRYCINSASINLEKRPIES